MKWVTHQAVAVGAAFVLGMPLPGLAGVWFGSVLPDVLDQKWAAMSRNPQKTFNRIHRGVTHWFGWWLALWVVGLATALPEIFGAMPPQVMDQAFAGLAGLGFGALMHVALDACTVSGVPVWPNTRRKRFSLGLCRTGGPGEYAFLGVATLLFWVLEHQELKALVREVRRFAEY